MFVSILTDVFNHWFAQEAIPGSITKGVITLLKKDGRHVWEELDEYRPITQLNKELKNLAQVVASRMHLVISDLVGPEQNYAVKERSIQDNLHLIHGILQEIEDYTEAALISLDQSKAFDRVAHCIRRWYHSFCVLLFGHRGCEEGGCEVWARGALPLAGWAWQTCPIALAAAVIWKKRLCTPIVASESVRFGVTSGSGQRALIPNS